MKNHIIILLAIFITGCQGVFCDVDKEFRDEFFKKIEIVKTAGAQDEISVDKLHGAFDYLETVTGIEGQYLDPHYRIYREEKAMEEDIEKWVEWYESNKCTITSQHADSLIKAEN